MRSALVMAAIVLLAACDGDGNNTVQTPEPTPTPAPTPDPVVEATYEVTTANLTNGQPLSPIAVILHDSSLSVFSVGTAASAGLELLAEGGDNSELLGEIEGLAEVSGEGPVGPGGSETLSVALTDDQTEGVSLSVISMLVNTNDAITGVNGGDVSALAVGESMTWVGNAYDAGTEANTEAAGTIPGPADGGEGFNAERDDVADFVTMHPGVVTADDGLMTSVLNESHRFDNPVVRVMVTRTQ